MFNDNNEQYTFDYDHFGETVKVETNIAQQADNKGTIPCTIIGGEFDGQRLDLCCYTIFNMWQKEQSYV